MAEKTIPYSSDTDILNTSLSPDIIRDAMDSDQSKLYKRLLGVESPTIGEIVGFPGSRTGRFSRVDKLRSVIQEQIAGQAMGPKQGDVGGGFPTPEASRIGVPEIGSMETVVPAGPQYPAGTGMLSPRDVQEWQTPLNPMQGSRLSAFTQLSGQRPLAVGEAQLGQSRMDEMVGILERQGTPRDKAKLEVYGSKGHLYSPTDKPGSVGARKTEAETRLTTGKAEEQERQNVFNPTKWLQEEEKRGAEIEKLRLDVEAFPKEQKRKDDLAKSLMTHRTKNRERSEALTKSIIAANISKADKDQALSTVNRIKALEFYMSQEDISREDMSASRAELMKEMGFLFELDKQYGGLLGLGADPGQKHRKLVTGSEDPSKSSAFADAPAGKAVGAILKKDGKPVAKWDGKAWQAITQ